MTNTEILLIADNSDDSRDHQLVEEAVALHPDQVTIVVAGESEGWEADASAGGQRRRDRLAYLLARVADRTGAAVVGTISSPSGADTGRFAAVVAPSLQVAA
ncbi:MAG: hypothetical protein WCL20_06900 [Actinomycetes bacterium]|nr:hypothetical protein [Solirubrobacterales bacterium]